MEGVFVDSHHAISGVGRVRSAAGRLSILFAAAIVLVMLPAHAAPDGAAAGFSAQRPLRLAAGETIAGFAGRAPEQSGGDDLVAEDDSPFTAIDDAYAAAAADGEVAGSAAHERSSGLSSPSPSAASSDSSPALDASDTSDASGAAARSPRELLTLGTPPAGASAAGDEAASSWMPAVSPNVAELIRIGGGLGAVLLLIVVLRLWLRAHGMGSVAAGRPSGVLEILARYPFARGQTLVVIRFGRRIVLVHQSGGVMQTLSELTDQNEVAQMLGRLESGASGRDAERFRSVLERFEREHDRSAGAPQTRGAAPRSAPVSTEGHVIEVVDLTRRSRSRPAATGGRITS